MHGLNESANVRKKINVRRWWWRSIVVATSKHTAYQKKSANNLKKRSMSQICKSLKNIQCEEMVAASRKESVNVGRKINVRRWWWCSIVITLLPNAWLTKKNLQTLKNQCEEVVVALPDADSGKQIGKSLKNIQCEEAVVAHEMVAQHGCLPEKNLQTLEKDQCEEVVVAHEESANVGKNNVRRQ